MLTEKFEKLSQVVKIVILVFFGWIFGGIYRIVKFVQSNESDRDIITLVAGILALVTGIGNAIAWVADVVCEVLYNKISLFAD